MRHRVLHVITTITKGGAESHLVELIQGQVAAGAQAAVAFLHSEPYWREALEGLGCEVVDLRSAHYGDLGAVARLRRLMRRWGPTLIHAHMPPAELYTRLAIAGLRTPLIISKHLDFDFAPAPGSSVLERWCAARAAAVIAISDAVRRYFEGRWPARLAERLTTIHYGIDLAPYPVVSADRSPLRAEWGLQPDHLVVGTAARLTPQKALDVMLRGFALATARAPELKLRLVLVGRGKLEAELRQLAADLAIADKVVFAGFRQDMPAVMSAYDIFALTSVFEGFGLVLLEAMAAARPVVASGISAIPEVVRDGETGLLVPPRDPQAFADAVVRLGDPVLRERLGAAGRQRASDAFAPARMVERTLALYDKVASELPARAKSG
jgi:glycosyltransferase involved in cell wall biosynthesis